MIDRSAYSHAMVRGYVLGYKAATRDRLRTTSDARLVAKLETLRLRCTYDVEQDAHRVCRIGMVRAEMARRGLKG